MRADGQHDGEGDGRPQPSLTLDRRVTGGIRQVVLTLVIVLLCCGAGVLALGGSDSDTASSSDSSSSAEDSSMSTAEEGSASVAPEPQKKEKTKDAPKKSAPGIGDAARDGKFEFTISKVEKGVASVGSEYFNEKADGQFVLVHITVKNIGDESQTLFDSEQKLKDTQGRSFSTDSSAAIAMEDNEMWLNEINPGNSAKGTLVYDMPADAQPAEIELHDSMFSGGVTVSLK